MTRRLRFHRSGWIVCIGAVFLGFAAIGTGNNLLFLLLGANLGFVILSGSLSELVLRRIEVRRRLPRGGFADQPLRITYELHNRKRWLPSFALEVGEIDAEARAFVASVGAGETVVARSEREWALRGVYPLSAVALATSFPFGFFRKTRTLELPGEMVVWPRVDRRVREPRVAGDRMMASGSVPVGAFGARGEFRSLRPYRPGDDPRDVHWRSTARVGQPVVREYERDRARALWLCLDLRGENGKEDAETVVEIAAALAERALARGASLGLATADARVGPAAGVGQRERVLDALARARFRPDAPPPHPPASPRECVLITRRAMAGGGMTGGWGDVLTPSEAEPPFPAPRTTLPSAGKHSG